MMDWLLSRCPGKNGQGYRYSIVGVKWLRSSLFEVEVSLEMRGQISDAPELVIKVSTDEFMSRLSQEMEIARNSILGIRLLDLTDFGNNRGG